LGSRLGPASSVGLGLRLPSVGLGLRLSSVGLGLRLSSVGLGLRLASPLGLLARLGLSRPAGWRLRRLHRPEHPWLDGLTPEIIALY
jgi:hypothetical protein